MPVLLVFTVRDQPRHVGADRAMAALLGAFSFAPVTYRQPHDGVVTFHAEIPDVQLEQLPAAVDALRALADVESVAVVTLTRGDDTASVASTPQKTEQSEKTGKTEKAEKAEPVGGDGESVRHPS